MLYILFVSKSGIFGAKETQSFSTLYELITRNIGFNRTLSISPMKEYTFFDITLAFSDQPERNYALCSIGSCIQFKLNFNVGMLTMSQYMVHMFFII